MFSLFHAPPRGTGATDTSVFTDPPSMSMRFNVPSAKNPRDRLSGDQKGDDARSVPGNGRADAESNLRNHNCDLPPDLAGKATLSPSGDIASDESLVGGVLISRRDFPERVGAGRKARAPNTAAISVTTASADAHTNRSRRPDRTFGSRVVPLCPAQDIINFKARVADVAEPEFLILLEAST